MDASTTTRFFLASSLCRMAEVQIVVFRETFSRETSQRRISGVIVADLPQLWYLLPAAKPDWHMRW